MEERVAQVERVLDFILGGNAEFIIKNTETGVGYQYKVVRNKDNDKMYFVHVTGGDYKYTYAGILIPVLGDWGFRKGKRGCINPEDPSIRGLLWAMGKGNNYLPYPMILTHLGKCAKCGKKLKDPESVERGFGPSCWKAIQNGGF